MDNRLDDHLSISFDGDHVDLALVSRDAAYRDDAGTEHIVDVDHPVRHRRRHPDRRHRGIPRPHSPAGQVSMLELGVETTDSARIAPMWAALLTGTADSRGLGTPGDEIRDPTRRVPHLWFDEPGDGSAAGQRFHVEVYVPHEAVEARASAVLAAGGTIVDDSMAPRLCIFADQDGNRGVLCAADAPVEPDA